METANTINNVAATIIGRRLFEAVEPSVKLVLGQIIALGVIIEQSQEFNSPLFLTFVDFERAFDILKHTTI